MMKKLKTVLAVLFVITLGLVGTAVAYYRGYLPTEVVAKFGKLETNKLALPTEFTPSMLTDFLPSDDSSESASESGKADIKAQLSVLSERSQEVGGHVGTVLGEYVQVNEQEDQPLHQSALEYGRYIYCQEVVKDYERENPEMLDE